jgi:hypothetical protein
MLENLPLRFIFEEELCEEEEEKLVLFSIDDCICAYLNC